VKKVAANGPRGKTVKKSGPLKSAAKHTTPAPVVQAATTNAAAQ